MRILVGFLAAIALATTVVSAGGPTLPVRLNGATFSQLSTDLSEPGGEFPSENLVSNELSFPSILDDLIARVPKQSVYLGVGPEQNFTYIAATRPRMAFIIDVRRGNLQLHLLYKALFELSENRNAFVSRLFGRNVPPKLSSTAKAAELFDAIEDLDPKRDTAADFAAITRQLTTRDGLSMPPDDLAAIRQLLATFWERGPDISYAPTNYSGMPAYWNVMQVTHDGRERSFLASEASFLIVKDLETRNLVVPVVGNLAGAKTVRAIGEYIRAHGATVGVMYVSNVEQYLVRDHSWRGFCLNARSLPLNEGSTFVRSTGVAYSNSPNSFSNAGLVSSIGPMQDQTLSCATDHGGPALPIRNRW